MQPDIKKILYATDLSEGARKAAWYAASVASRYGAEVSVLHVVPDLVEEWSQGAGFDIEEHFGSEQWESFNRQGIESARANVRDRVGALCGEIAQASGSCPFSPDHVRVVMGKPADAIIREAEEGGYDLVVLGTHGQGSAVEQAVIGSVAAKVVRTCTRPVLVVRIKG